MPSRQTRHGRWFSAREREFQNELLFAGKIESDRILIACFIARFGAKRVEKRLSIAIDIAKARLKPEDECRVDLNSKIEEGKKTGNSLMEDNGSVFEETESLATTTVCEEFSVVPDNQSPESFVTARIAETSPDTVTQSPRIGGGAGKDWWWKQDNGMSESGRVKDYVMEWIGSEINKERPKTEWIATGASSSAGQTIKSEKKKKKTGLVDFIG
ncbi:hypothetical protein E3N88_12754 [Mikania micrantha]|uniref:Uncharacterized protein n=1 Tax=Mikania micrantha TaxID=192012 RepID=A0A5N6P6G1_9ASTR|nr:hypothetical protein E3N88_12754 [Mikania micrantha]